MSQRSKEREGGPTLALSLTSAVGCPSDPNIARLGLFKPDKWARLCPCPLA
jgi:hypothetical protein